MKLKFSFIFLLITCVSLAQIPKVKEVHQFFEATLQSIKKADTTAFVKLWSQPNYYRENSSGAMDSIAYSERRRIEFKAICSNWQPYLNDLNFEIDCHEKSKPKVPNENLGYDFTVCLTSKAKPKSHKYLFIGMSFKYIDARLYCTSLLPLEILNVLEGW